MTNDAQQRLQLQLEARAARHRRMQLQRAIANLSRGVKLLQDRGHTTAANAAAQDLARHREQLAELKTK